VPSKPKKPGEFFADAVIGDIPVADVELDITPEEEAVGITLMVAEDDIQILPTSLRKFVTVEGQSHYRIIPEEFEDLLMLVTYKLE